VVVSRHQTAPAVPQGPVSWESLAQAMRLKGYTDTEIVDLMVLATKPQEATTTATLITVQEFCEKYGASYTAVMNWIYRGRISEKGRSPFSAPGGGKVLIDEDEALEYMKHGRSKGGRPKKRG
jgi:hypothetical protein